ncbi:MAG: tRNA pseudouridine(55) synthase TruB [Gemmatimonadota bacterium]|nr:tRNA pseudouridine(55) synthase TruB [Gemmatimonadota bacterium]
MRLDAGDFVLPVDKPEGPTSHDVVAAARMALGTRRVGHTGTLDPFASGLLILCVGKATRLAEYLSGLDKEYVAEARLGVGTDTLDREGEVVDEDDVWATLTRERIEEALASLSGDIAQVPPQFSAKKIDGEAMHRRARRGERVELAPVQLTIHSLELEKLDLPVLRFRVVCSTGTYVRALARDLGWALGTAAHLTALRRTRVGGFDVESAVPVDDLGREEAVSRARIGPVEAVRHLGRIEVGLEEAGRIRHGQRVRVASGVSAILDGEGTTLVAPPLGTEPRLVAVAYGGDLLAIGTYEDGVVKPRKVFPE